MYNCGQTCCAAKRFIVVEAVADKFLAEFKKACTRMNGLRRERRRHEGTTRSDARLCHDFQLVSAAGSAAARAMCPSRIGHAATDAPGSLPAPFGAGFPIPGQVPALPASP